MNPVTHAVNEATRRIPSRILEKVFVAPGQGWRQAPVNNVHEQIKERVVYPRVITDCNLVGGAHVRIRLDGVPYDVAENDYTHIYRIPKDLTNGRTITSVLDVAYGTQYQAQSHRGGIGMSRGGAAVMMASAVMEAQLRPSHTNTARVTLVGENTVMVQDTVMIAANLYLRCMVAHDENMSHLQARNFRPFAKLVELAVKAYIYNEYVIEMDMGELHGGANLGMFKTVIDGYADAEQMYQDFITEKWQKIDFMNDDSNFQRFIALMVGGVR